MTTSARAPLITPRYIRRSPNPANAIHTVGYFTGRDTNIYVNAPPPA